MRNSNSPWQRYSENSPAKAGSAHQDDNSLNRYELFVLNGTKQCNWLNTANGFRRQKCVAISNSCQENLGVCTGNFKRAVGNSFYGVFV